MRTGFVVLQDTADSDVVSAELPFEAPRVISYPSGRPWIVGCWEEDEVVSAQVGPMQVVVIGFCPVTTTDLAALTSRVRTVSDIDRLATLLPGSFHLVATVDGHLRIQGSITGLRRVSWTMVGNSTIASDRTDLLATLTDADVNEHLLATRVACGGMLPSPLRDQSMWHGVHTLPPDHCLLALRGQTVREVKWWQPPDPEVALSEGARSVRDALTTAVTDRKPPRGRLSADLSGGMDSTSLCFLAAHDTPDLITYRWAEAEAGNDDGQYAAHAIQALPHAEHITAPQDEIPAVFADTHLTDDPEQPYLFTRTTARTLHTARTLAAHGSRWHIAGHGGDELFYKFPGYVHQLLRRRPITAIRHIRAHRALSRWPLGATFTELVHSGDATAWWRAQADQLTEPPPADRFPPLGWGFMPLRAQPWVTDDAVHAARETLRKAAEQVRPFARDRGQHQFLLALRTTAPAYAQLARLFTKAGVRLHMPYLDDRVVEAALAVRLDERAHPWRYKPLLAEAMRGIVPHQILARTTKGEFSGDLRAGLRRNLTHIFGLLAESTIAGRGLIDPDELRRQLLAPQADHVRNIALEHLLGCEAWLRTVSGRNNALTP